jgi:hypothetical protein
MILTDTHQEALLNSYFPNGITQPLMAAANAYLQGIIKGIELHQEHLKNR